MNSNHPADDLLDAAIARKNSLAQYKRDHARLCRLVLEARDAGIPLAHIAEFAGVSRVTVYSIIARANEREAKRPKRVGPAV